MMFTVDLCHASSPRTSAHDQRNASSAAADHDVTGDITDYGQQGDNYEHVHNNR